MRQYRGIPIDGKDFVYGWYIELGNHHLIADETTDWDNAGEVGVIEIEGLIEVIPETVGQSTGYKYKSLKDAYEGDIFDAYPDGSRRFLRTIIWDDELARFQAPYSDGSGIQLFTKRECLLYEYVGNIHQHPNLLEQDNARP